MVASRRKSRLREAILVGAGSLLYAAIFCYPMLCQVGQLGPGIRDWLFAFDLSHFRGWPVNGDWDLFTELRWVPYYTLTHFHQLPFWNPYKCGGMGMLSNPESAIVTPFLLPYLLVGPHAGIYLEIYLHVALAFAGGYLLARMMGLNVLAAIGCGAMFPASSWLYLHLAVGHLNFLPAVYLPWIAAMLMVAIQRKSLYYAAIGGLLAALTLTEGNYTFLYAAIIVASLATILSIQKLSLRPFMTGLVIGVFGLSFAALKLMPMAQQLTIYPKHPFGLEAISMKEILVFLFSGQQDLYRPGGPWEFMFCEYGAFVSVAFVALAIVGITTRPLRVLPWLIPATIFLLFARGYTGTYSPVLLLRYLPLSRNAGLTGRYLIPFVFCLDVVAAFGVDALCSMFSGRGTTVAAVLLGAGLAMSWIAGAPNLRYLFHNPPVTLPASPEFKQLYEANPSNMTEVGEANMGSVNCQGVGYNDIPENPLGYNQPGYRGEYHLLGGGTASETSWTPNRLSYLVSSGTATTLVINQNYYPGWHLAQGDGQIAPYNGLISVRLPPGTHEIVVSFTPERFWLACLATLLAFAATVALYVYERRRRQPVDQMPGATSGSSSEIGSSPPSP